MSKTIQELAMMACDVQDACNSSGVARALSETVFPALWEHARAQGLGTEWVNCHPIVIAFLDKLMALAYAQNEVGKVVWAHTCCDLLSKGDSVKGGVY